MTVESNLAVAIEDQGRHAEADAILRSQLVRRTKLLGDEHPATVDSLHNVAQNLVEAGQDAESEPLLRRALELSRRIFGPSHPATVQFHLSLAGCLSRQKRFDEAAELHQRLIEIAEKAPNYPRSELAKIYMVAANSSHGQGKVDRAEKHYRKALQLEREGGAVTFPAPGGCRAGFAAFLRAQGRPDEAEPLIQDALKVRRKTLSDNHPVMSAAYTELARIFYGQGKYLAAEEALVKALPGFENLRQGAANAGLERSLVASESPLVLLACLQARRGKSTDAWRSLEASLARGLLDEVTAFRNRPLDPAEAKREKEARQRVDLLRGQLAALQAVALPSADEKAKLAQIGKDLEEAQLNRSSIENELVREYGPAVGKPYSLDEIQSRIPPDVALVAWVDAFAQRSGGSAGGEHWACVLRRRGAPRWIKLPGSGEHGAWPMPDSLLGGQLRRLIAVRPKEGDEQWRESAKRLRQQRITPLRETLNAKGDLPAVRHLVVLPSPAIAGIPVEAILEPAELKTLTISYAPSATLFVWLGQRGHDSDVGKPTRLLALGDPEFLNAPKTSDVKTRPTTDELLKRVGGQPLTDLPGSRQEVEAICRLFSKSEKLLGADASELKLESLAKTGRLKEFDILHLASHGIIDDRIPMNSALMLTQVDLPDALTQALAGKKVYEGKVTARQIRQDWKLNAQLVTLSACQTGLGKYSAGEGFLGFSQSLFFAGSQNVVLSLWKVDDTATALLMQRFYQNLQGAGSDSKEPQSKARALQLAKEWLRNLNVNEVKELVKRLPKVERAKPRPPSAPQFEPARQFDHPYFWAGFVLIGGPR